MKQKDDPIGKWRSDNAIQQITAEAASDIAKKIAATKPQKTHEEEVTEWAEKIVVDSIQVFVRMRNIRIVPTTFAEAVEMVYNLQKAEFTKWTKEDLLILCSFQNALIATQKLQSELI